jgi:hypothetical protein
MEWEHGDVTPGRVMATLKTGGLRDLLEAAVAQRAGPQPEEAPAGESDTWTPVV